MNQISTRVLGSLYLFLVLAGSAAVYGEPRLNPGDGLVRIGQISEPLPLEELVLASLIASGVSEGNLETYTSKVMALVDSAPGRAGSMAQDAEILLEWMHENVLNRYVLNQTKMDVLLDKGTYNCVSSAVLYLILVRSRDMTVHGVLTPDHAFCRVDGIDVETTTAYGFDPGTRREAVDSFSGRTGFTYVPPGNYNQRQDIGEKELISLIYQNRLAELQRLRCWEEAVGLAMDRWALAGSMSAERDFRVSISNYAADLDRKRMEIEGLVFLNQAALSLGKGHGLGETASALLGNAVTYYLRVGKTDEAQALLNDEELTALVPIDSIDERLREVKEKELEILVKTASFQEATAGVDKSYSETLISRDRWGELSIYLWSNEARRQAVGGKWLEGWLFLQEAPGEYIQIPGWRRMEETYSNNAVVVFHNRFADALRKENYSSARGILDESLEYFPGSSMLKQDDATLENLQ